MYLLSRNSRINCSLLIVLTPVLKENSNQFHFVLPFDVYQEGKCGTKKYIFSYHHFPLKTNNIDFVYKLKAKSKNSFVKTLSEQQSMKSVLSNVALLNQYCTFNTTSTTNVLKYIKKYNNMFES